MSKAVDNFWQEWAKLGEEMVEYGNQIGFGNSFFELKFKDKVPAIIVHSKQVNTVYPDNSAAKASVGKLLEEAESRKYDGATTFTLGWNKGRITRIILDEYSNSLIL